VRNLEVVKYYFPCGDVANQIDMKWFLLLFQDCSKNKKIWGN